MATKKMSTGLKIILPVSTVKRVERIVSRPQTKVQQKIISEATGLYSLYQAKWLKTK